MTRGGAGNALAAALAGISSALCSGFSAFPLRRR
nr:MAG TPA: hypothetical protein [Caudoviricetes sp.]